jgi:8-oxo-dGTP pyrophosphatase MutT (NUDIX family)
VHFNEYISRLRARLTSGLPGLEAQRLMAPHGRLTVGYEAEPHDARHGAVLIILLDRGMGPELPLIVRADDGGTHGGQIGLPGGGFEEGDEFPTGTALREAEEEIAAVPQQVDVLGTLTPLYIWVSNYRITPVVGAYTGDPASFSPNPSEVTRIVIAAVEELMAGHEYRTVDARGTPLHVPAYGLGEVDVWGATAMMLSEFFAVHRDVWAARDGNFAPDARGGLEGGR